MRRLQVGDPIKDSVSEVCRSCSDLSLNHILFPQVWDARKFKAPVAVFGDLPNSYGQTNVAFSPDEQLIVTGTSYEKGEDAPGGQIVFFDRERLELVRKVGIAPTQSVVRVHWHPRLNQVSLRILSIFLLNVRLCAVQCPWSV